jgi:uncharacterized protein (DUF2236 family)
MDESLYKRADLFFRYMRGELDATAAARAFRDLLPPNAVLAMPKAKEPRVQAKFDELLKALESISKDPKA